MTTSTPNTPQELVDMNNQNQVETILEQDLSLEETYQLTLSLIQRLGMFHQSMIEQLKEESDTDRLVVWSQDEQTLHHCHDMIRVVSEND